MRIKDFLEVISSNILVMILGIISSIVIPRSMSPEQFGYWQLFTLYSSYVGVTILGFCDGIYLRYGGEKYSQIDKKKFSSLFYVLISYTFIIAIIGILIIINTNIEFNKKYILISVCICIILQCSNSFFILLNQATSRFKIYSVANAIDKVILLALVLIWIIFRNLDFIIIINICLLSKFITLIYNVLKSKEIIFKRPTISKSLANEIKLNLIAGLPLTISGIASMLISGMGKFVIEDKLSIEQFGYYSFVFSVLGVVLQVVMAVSIILYPSMRKSKEDLVNFAYNTENFFTVFGCIALILYYPAKWIIYILLPKYIPSINCILIVFPTVIFQAKLSVIYNNIYKVNRMEKNILLNNLYALIFCFVITIFGFFLNSTIEMISFTTLLSYYFWYMLFKLEYFKRNKTKNPSFFTDLIIIIFFIGLNILFSDFISLILFLIICFITCIFKKKYIIYILKKIS
ncbi:oligosaccharide flippase family protein [Clostridium perfringens]|nr:oligosaccharide flippase family protein [Clostridium perfringens]